MDWQIKRTFKLIEKSKGPVSSITKTDLRSFYIQATENHSQASFIDFVSRCKVSGFLIPDRPHRPVFFEVKNFKGALDA